MSNQYTEYFAKVWFQSAEEPVSFAIPEDSWLRLNNCYRDKTPGFFVTTTNDGRFVAINMTLIDIIHFLWQSPCINWPEHEHDSCITLHMRDRKAKTFWVDEAKEVADIMFFLEAGDQSFALSFTDIDGEEVMFSPERLLWVEAAQEFVDEGFEELNREMLGI